MVHKSDRELIYEFSACFLPAFSILIKVHVDLSDFLLTSVHEEKDSFKFHIKCRCHYFNLTSTETIFLSQRSPIILNYTLYLFQLLIRLFFRQTKDRCNGCSKSIKLLYSSTFNDNTSPSVRTRICKDSKHTLV